MARQSVAYRLKAVGEDAILKSWKSVGEAGEASSKRTAAAFNRDMRIAETAVERLERRAARMGASQTDTQRQINDFVGLSRSGSQLKSAEASMKAFIRSQDQMAASRSRLLSQFDPLFAAQQRHNKAIREATQLRKQGALSTAEFTNIQTRAKTELDAFTNAQRRGTVSAGQQRAAYNQLGFQFQDITQGFALGVDPLVILAQQGGQTASALSMGLGETGTAGKVARFIAGPWGALIIGGTAILGSMVSKLYEVEEAAQAAQAGADGLGKAQSVLGDMFDLANGRIEKQNALLEANARLAAITLRSEALQQRQAARSAATNTGRLGLGEALGRLATGNISPIGFEQATLINSFRDTLEVKDRAQRNKSLNRILRESEGVDFKQLGIARSEFQQAVVDAISADFKDDTANLIDQALDTRSLPDALRQPSGSGRAGGERDRLALAARATAELQRTQEANAKSVLNFLTANDPLLKITEEYRSKIKEISRLEAAGPANGGLTTEQAVQLRTQAKNERIDARAGAFAISGLDSVTQRADREQNLIDFTQGILADHDERLEILRVERSLIGETSVEREVQLNKLELILNMRRAGVDVEADIGQQILEQNEQIDRQSQALRQQQENWDALRQTGEQFVDTVFDLQNWNDFGDLGKRVLQDIADDMIRLTLLNPLKNLLFDSSLPTFGGGGSGAGSGGLFGSILQGLGGFFGGGNAVGTEYFPGGFTEVGENGKELVSLPRGSRIHTASQTRQMERKMASAGTTVHMNVPISADGADSVALARVEQRLEEMKRDLPSTIVSTVSDAQSRFMLPGGR